MLYTVAAFYRFLPLQNLPSLRQALLAELKPLNLCGSLLLAPEGMNGTLAGTSNAIDAALEYLNQENGLLREDVKFSNAAEKPFNRLKIRLKREIITFQQPSADPNIQSGTPVAPRDWNALLDDPEVILLDTRNKYETMIGSFADARDPQIETFTEFAAYVRSHLDPKQHKKIAMFCTGGIRCEKASAFMLAEGFPEVYHLKGGILKYLEEIPSDASKWNGECYVFDKRMAVGHGLTTGRFSMCFGCGYPLTAEDKLHAHYEDGVSCSNCHAETSPDDKKRYRARQQQVTASVHQAANNGET
ncbi:MAG: rhodanese-related sulfurtransferase [Alphaproteobacteria bacterium]|nr:rhodanese-related sulfurtransferase [Alphaproteobacteria bacterium]